MSTELITDWWLRAVGFKPHFLADQPNRHWLLWLGEEIGIELSFGREKPRPWWFCWLRSGGEHSYGHVIHVRYVTTKREVVALAEAITGKRWNPATHRYGAAFRQKR